MKKLAVTSFLILCLLGLQVGQAQTTPPPRPNFVLVEACVALAIIGVLTVTLVCVTIYNHHGDATHTPPQFLTNCPPQNIYTNGWPEAPWTNEPVAINLSGSPLPAYDISALGFQDNNTDVQCLYTNTIAFYLDGGQSPGSLQPLYQVQAWLSGAGRMVQFQDTNGTTLGCLYATWDQIPRAPLFIGTGREPSRFYRVRPQ